MSNNLTKIEFKIEEIKILNFFENDPSNFNINKSQYNAADVDIGFNLKINDKDENIDIILKTIFHLKENKNIVFFGLNSLFRYKIANFSKSIKKIGNNYQIPDKFLKILLELSLSGTRGMIVPLLSIQEYKHLILPIIDPMNLLKNIKKG